MKLSRLLRAEYIWQPAQLARRAWRLGRRVHQQPEKEVRLPWGFPITVDPRESIGRSIIALNTLDLPVTESIWRLLDDGELCADIGANIGYMTSVMAARVREGGSIRVFEPLPLLANLLRVHVRRWAPHTRAVIEVHQVAVSDKSGPATIFVPPSFAENRGQATLVPPGVRTDDGTTASVPLMIECVRLDESFGCDARLGIVKIDVEGFEYEVLRSAAELLRTGRIRDIVFEEHRPFEAPSHRYLRENDYAVFRVARGLMGPALVPPHVVPRGEVDPATYLATLDPARARRRFARRGWLVLRGIIPPR
jgi:FkbM family methyltransferase